MKPSNKRAIFVSLAGNLGISAAKSLAAAFYGQLGDDGRSYSFVCGFYA